MVTIEGYTPEELLSLDRIEFESFIFTSSPVVFRAGSATVLSEFTREPGLLNVRLAHIDEGGEGVLRSIFQLARSYARESEIDAIEWIVDAVNCAEPNHKLRRLLEARGFQIRSLPEGGTVYWQRVRI